MLSSLQQYGEFVYTLSQRFPSIQVSTLTLVPRGMHLGTLTGALEFTGEIRLEVIEEVDFARQYILTYFYAVTQSGERVWWYDPQPHPNNPDLAATHPHHKHIEPDIKHHRIPAPGLSFTEPNLPFLIREIETTLLRRD